MPVLPATCFRGELADAWEAVHAGRIRAASQLLTATSARHTQGIRPLGPVETAELASLLVTCQLASGDLAEAARTAEALVPHLVEGGVATTIAHLGLGELTAARGDQEQALEHYLKAGASRGADDPSLVPWRTGAAVAMVATGRRREALDLAREEVARAEAAGAPHLLARSLRALATVDAGSSLVLLRRAHDAAASTPDQRLAAQIATDLGGLLLLSGRADEALGLLRSAESYAAGEDLWPLHSRVKRLLQRAGEQARPLARDTLALLTTAEQRVARLATTGLMNREIAEELQVSVKAVEWHLSRVYRKLGIPSRAALARTLHPSG